MAGFTIQNRRLLSGFVVFSLVASVVVLAARADGREASEARSNDGGAWLAHREEGGAVHVEHASRQDTMTAKTFDADAPLVVMQDEEVAAVVDPASGSVAVIDQTSGATAAEVRTPEGTEVRARKGGLAVFDPADSRLWLMTTGQLSTNPDFASVPPSYPGGQRGQLVLLRNGDVAVVHENHAVFVGASIDDHVEVELPAGFSPDLVSGAGDRIVAVDEDRWVVADRSGFDEIDTDTGGVAQLQWEGSASTRMGYVGADGTAGVVNLASGMNQTAPLNIDPTVRPIWHNNCLFVVGRVQQTVGLWAVCQGRAEPTPLLPQRDGRSLPPDTSMRVVNGWVWLDTHDGRGWTVTETLEVREIDVADAFENSDGDEEDPDGEIEERLNQDSADAETTDADEQDNDLVNEPPTAQDDDAATRLGRAVFVDVLRNDSDPDGDVLLVDRVQVLDGANLARVEKPASGLGVQVTPLGGIGTVRARYWVSDGSPGGEDSAIVTVELKPLTMEGNLPPIANLDRLTGAAGSIVSANLLRNDEDPDGDSIVLLDIDTPPNVELRALHPGGDILLRLPEQPLESELNLPYTITDEWGQPGDETGELRLTIRLDDGNTTPDARNDVVRTQVGRRVSVDLLANDVDGDNDQLVIGQQVTPVSGDVAGFLDSTEEGVFTFEPTAPGTFVFTYSATDRSASDEAIVRVEVAPNTGNRPPIAIRDDVTLAQGESRLVRALENDGDPDGDLFGSVEVVENPNLTVVPEPGIGFTVTMQPGADVVETFQYRISDGSNDSELATIVVTRSDVAFTDAAPVANDDSARVRPGRTSRIFPLRNDFDPEGGRLSIIDAAVAADEAGVSVAVGGGGQWIDVSVDGTRGAPFAVQYVVADVGDNRDTATVDTVVIPAGEQNSPPIARGDVSYTRENLPVAIDVLANDDDPESDPIRLVAVSQAPANGAASLDPDRATITYTPNQAFRGTDGFGYLVEDSEGAQTQGFVQIAVMRESTSNNPPIAVDDEFSVPAGSGEIPLDVLDNDFDPDGDRITIIAVAGGGSIADSERTLRFAPPSEAREDQTIGLEYTITDGAGGIDTAQVTVTILANVDPIAPIAVPDEAGPFKEGATARIEVRGNDIDEDGDPAELVVTTEEAAATVLPSGEIELLVPAESFEFVYTVTDSDDLSSSARVRIEVEPNLPPDVQNPIDLGEVFNDETIEVDLSEFVTDPEDDELVFSDITAQSGGTTRLLPGPTDARLLRFEPSTNHRGEAGFSFTVEDTFGHRVSGRVTLTLLGPANEPPLISDAAIDVEAGLVLPFDVATLFDDPDPGDSLTYSVSDPASADLTLSQSGSVLSLSAPLTSAAFSTTIEVTATDASGSSSVDADGNQRPAVLTVNVIETTIDPPTAVADGPSDATAGNPVSAELAANDIDHLGQGLRIINAFVVGGAPVGTVANTDSTVTFTPAAAFSGEATIEYTVRDGRQGSGGESKGLWTVNVVGPPEAPTSLTAEAVGGTTASLSWVGGNTNGAPIEAHEIRLNGGEVRRVEGANPGTLIDGLSPGEGYVFEVRAINRAGDGPWSNPSLEVVPDAAPSPPGAPIANFLADQPGSIEVQWVPGAANSESSAIASFTVEIGQCTSAIREGIEGSQTTWTDLPNGVRCAFRVTAVNQTGLESQPGPWSDPECAVAVPGATTITDVERGDKLATVTWTAPDNPDCENLLGYEILRLRNGAADGTQAVPSGTLSWPSTPLQNGDTYTFQVRAQNRAGWGPYGPPSDAVIPCGVPIDVPTPVADPLDERVRLTWAGDANANGCAITQYRYQIRSGGTGEGDISNGGEITGLSNGTDYRIAIAAVNEIGQSEWSAESNIARPIGPPFAPTVVGSRCLPDAPDVCFSVTPNGDNGSPITDATGNVPWTFHGPAWSPFEPDSVANYWCQNNLGSRCLVEAGQFTEGYPPQGCLQNSETITATASLVNAAGTGPSSSASITLVGCPGTPSLSLDAGNGQVTANFSRPSGTDRLYVEVDGGTPQEFGGSSFTQSGPNGVPISFRIWACNEGGCSSSNAQSEPPVAPGILITADWLRNTICSPIPYRAPFEGAALSYGPQIAMGGAGNAGTVTCHWYDRNALHLTEDGGHTAPSGGQVVQYNNDLLIQYAGSRVCSYVGRSFDNRADGGYCV